MNMWLFKILREERRKYLSTSFLLTESLNMLNADIAELQNLMKKLTTCIRDIGILEFLRVTADIYFVS